MSPSILKTQLLTALLALLVLVACSDPATTAVVAPLATSQSETSTSTGNEPRPTPTVYQAPEQTGVATPLLTGIPTTVPEPTATAELASTPIPGSTPTPMATPRSTATPTIAPIQRPTQAFIFWRGITVAPEERCSPYDPDDYSYPQSVEPRIVEEMGGIIYGPYTGRWFSSTRDTDIEHIVARSEAHDSGLCAADEVRSRFSSDLLNLTLASPEVNRHQKRDKDAAEWLPELNQCWFADRVIRVRLEYGLTVDQEEADALDAILSECSSFEMVVVPSTLPPSPTPTTPKSVSTVDALAMWDENGNGRISCEEARNHGIAPVDSDHPAYPYMNDRDGDGVVCE